MATHTVVPVNNFSPVGTFRLVELIFLNTTSHIFGDIDHEIISTVSLLLSLIQRGLISVTSNSMCKKYWLTALSSFPREKCG